MSKFKEIMNVKDYNLKQLFVVIYITVIWAFPIGFSNGSLLGYKEGQLDYQKGIIKYEIQEVTTDVIRRIK